MKHSLGCMANCNPRKYCKVQLEQTMVWRCPDCGHELTDLAAQLGDVAKDEVLELVEQILGYYCPGCSDFYGNDALRQQVLDV